MREKKEIEALRLYHEGVDMERYHGKAVAFNYYRLAARSGNDKAQYRLGLCYEEGAGPQIDQDYGQAFACYKGAARNGNHKAQ